MAFACFRVNIARRMVQNVCYTALLMRRSMAFKSALALENLYPNSSLKLTTPSFKPDPNARYTGYVPIEKLDITYSASSGPGGQNVNKVHTKVDLRFKLNDADWIHPETKAKMMELYGNKLTKDGYLVIRSDLTRSQQLNLADCLQKLRNMMREAAVTKREPSPETQERIRQRHLKAARLRLMVKREESQKRALKRAPEGIDL